MSDLSTANQSKHLRNVLSPGDIAATPTVKGLCALGAGVGLGAAAAHCMGADAPTSAASAAKFRVSTLSARQFAPSNIASYINVKPEYVRLLHVGYQFAQLRHTPHRDQNDELALFAVRSPAHNFEEKITNLMQLARKAQRSFR